MTRYPFFVIVALVLLRLAVGWHFFSEGAKKLEPGFSSSGFLLAAKGPLAPLYHGVVKGPHDARKLLTKPREQGSLSDEAAKEYSTWRSTYGKAAATALKQGKPLPEASEYSPHAPYAAWFERITADSNGAINRMKKLPASSDKQLEQAEILNQQSLGELLYYLDGEQEAIADLRHEAWRLEQLRHEAQDSSAPFYAERIQEKQAQIHQAIRPWMTTVEEYEKELSDNIVKVAEKEEASAYTIGRLRSALAEPTWLRTVDFVVTWTVILCGVCLFLGLLTPIAAIVAAGFLVSVILSQFPCTPGANTTYFFYQLVEIASLLVLAATGAGRWAGIGAIQQVLRKIDNKAPHNAPRNAATSKA